MQASDFDNIFNFLNLGRKEEVFHTPMIHRLLSLEDDLFLGNFFETLGETHPDLGVCKTWVKEFAWNVACEKIVTEGEIDILLSPIRKESQTDFCRTILIENKIKAPETKAKEEKEKGQIEKYGDWLSTRDPHGIIFLLSPDGRKSVSAGKHQHLCFSLNYSHVQIWLEKCLPHIKNTKLKMAVEDYLEIVCRLIPIPPYSNIKEKSGKQNLPDIKYHKISYSFLEALIQRLRQDMKFLEFHLINDDVRRVNHIIGIHQKFANIPDKPLIWLSIEIYYGNAKHTGLWYGFQLQYPSKQYKPRYYFRSWMKTMDDLPELHALNQFIKWGNESSSPHVTLSNKETGWLAWKQPIEQIREDGLLASWIKDNKYLQQECVDRVSNLISHCEQLWIDANTALLND